MRLDLPIEAAIPDLIAAIASDRQAVLQAPPGAGKTTRVPVALSDHIAGRIVMLEPRRLAARAAAVRMAEQLGEPVGRQVGYAMRGAREMSAHTKILVVTEGVLTRMIQDDPELSGIGAVIFDEFHERSLATDLGLALCLELRSGLRPDLALVVMSATMDAAPVARLMGNAPIITSQGRAFPVDIIWRDRPLGQSPWQDAICRLIEKAALETTGNVLVFCPGAFEIQRLAQVLSSRLSPKTALTSLHGSMPFYQQQAAIAPSESGQKVVLASAIAETSLTIQGVTAVVDGGLARRARFDPSSGMSRLVTERVSKAEATQRAGRAGRLGPGRCYRLWAKSEEGGLRSHPPAEIEVADLTGLTLELAAWGNADLPFLTPPPSGGIAGARTILTRLGAFLNGSITRHGRELLKVPLHPRLAHMLLSGGKRAAQIAALLSERDILGPKAPIDLTLRLHALNDPKRVEAKISRPIAPEALTRIRTEAKRLTKWQGGASNSPAQLAALAFPDRVGLRRNGTMPRYLLSGGKGAIMDAADPMSGARMIVVSDTDGSAREARIRQAIEITPSELRECFASDVQWHKICKWSQREGRVIAEIQEKFGTLILDRRSWKDVPIETSTNAMLEGIRELGLLWGPNAARLRARVNLVRELDDSLPDFTDAALLSSAQDWLSPYVQGITTAAQWRKFDITAALFGLLDWTQKQLLDRHAPAYFETALGRRIVVNYEETTPTVAVRLQEMFGITKHPTIVGKPLRLALLSPANRVVQTTMDLPGFWRSSYQEVRKDMRGRYPKHPWPEDPIQAKPTQRTKPKGIKVDKALK